MCGAYATIQMPSACAAVLDQNASPVRRTPCLSYTTKPSTRRLQKHASDTQIGNAGKHDTADPPKWSQLPSVHQGTTTPKTDRTDTTTIRLQMSMPPHGTKCFNVTDRRTQSVRVSLGPHRPLRHLIYRSSTAGREQFGHYIPPNCTIPSV